MSSPLSKNPIVQKRNELLANKVHNLMLEGKEMKEIAESLNYSPGFLYVIHRHYHGVIRGKKRATEQAPVQTQLAVEEEKPAPVEIVITEPAIAAFLYMSSVFVVRLQFDPNYAGKVVFVYHQTEELDRLVSEFMNNERMVYPQEFSKATRHIFHTIKDFQNRASGRSHSYGQANTL